MILIFMLFGKGVEGGKGRRREGAFSRQSLPGGKVSGEHAQASGYPAPDQLSQE